MKKLNAFKSLLKLALLIILIGVFQLSLNAQSTKNVYSVSNGNWSDGNTWSLTSGGPDCDCTPAPSNPGKDSIFIEGGYQVTLDINLQTTNLVQGHLNIMDNTSSLYTTTKNIQISAGADLIVYGNLDVNDMKWGNQSYVYVAAGAVVHVHGALANGNNSDDIIIDGSLIVDGDLSNGLGAIIDGSGSISVGGTIDDPEGGIQVPVMPITLTDFTAKPDGDIVNLYWRTASEVNNDYFTVEKSSANTLIFEFVDNVKGAGNSNIPVDYFATDFSPYMGNSYYRLKQTDFDGRVTYSNLLAVTVNKLMGELNVFPIPSDGNMNINLNTPAVELFVVVYDVYGNEHFSKLLVNQSGTVLYGLDLRNKLTPGVYLIRASNVNGIYEKKIVIR